MSKFIYLVSLKGEKLKYKNIQSLDISLDLTGYINRLEYIENYKFNIITYLKYLYNLYKKRKHELNIVLKIKETLKYGEKIILGKDIYRSKYLYKIQNLIGKRNISDKSFSIFQNIINFDIYDVYNSICIITKKEIDLKLYIYLIKKFKRVDIYSQEEKNKRIIEETNLEYGTSNKVRKNKNLSSYNIVINLNYAYENLKDVTYSKKAILIDDYNMLNKNEKESYVILKNIEKYYTREDINIEEKELFKNYNLASIAYLLGA